MPGHIIPDNPLEFIQQCVRQRKIWWTYHVNMRLKGRFIEIIEEYPKDKYLPSHLVYSRYKNRIFHVLFAADVEDDNVRIITAYYPGLEEWEEDLKTRRRSL